MSKREVILGATADLVRNFMYYDRKEDEDLTVDEIWESIDSGEVTKDEIVKQFSKHLNGIKIENDTIIFYDD